MKIAILHLTMGLINRGSEVTTDIIATKLSQKHQVLVLQAGKINKSKKYLARRIYPLSSAPTIAPRNMIDKILFRLFLDQSSRHARAFSSLAIPHLLQYKPDIVFATNGGDQVKIIKKSLPKTKVVVIGHAGIGYDDLHNLKSEPDLFLAVSQQAESWAHQHKKAKTKVGLFLNPFDPDLYAHSSPLPHNLPHPVVLVVGAATAYKNIPKTIKACRQLNVSLLLVSQGEQSDLIAKELAHYPTDFRWVQDVDPKDMPSYYQSADVFFFIPEKQEAFGRVYLEAMATGLPIVATDDAIRRNLIGPKGFYADPHQPASIVKALQKAIASPRLSYAKELQSYSIEQVVQKLEQDLYDLLKT